MSDKTPKADLTADERAHIEAFEALPLDAKLVFGLWFGLGRKETFTLTFHMRESRPAPRTQAALDLLVAQGIISVTTEGSSVVYRTLFDAFAAFLWAQHYLDQIGDAWEAQKWSLMEPVT